jgi:hypothetical protein
MSEDCVVLWRDTDETHDVCFEIVQLGEGEFELRVLRDGRVSLEEDSSDLPTLMARARELHTGALAR